MILFLSSLYTIMNIQNMGLIAMAIGAASVIYFMCTLVRQFSVGRWSRAQGEVLESRVDDSRSSCEPYVKYRYSVDGRSYQSDRFRPVQYRHDIQNIGAVKKMIAPFHVGKIVDVYYDPKNPADAVLKKRDSIFVNIFWVIFAGIFIFAGWEMMSQPASPQKTSPAQSKAPGNR
jgi:Protein of unknown function (DUF3592)